jgi:hypothetical protein
MQLASPQADSYRKINPAADMAATTGKIAGNIRRRRTAIEIRAQPQETSDANSEYNYG